MRRPNFFIIGAPKCGTTSLAAWLRSHPHIYIPPNKEFHFYSSDLNMPGRPRTEEEYLRYFQGVGSNIVAVGEASTTYLASQVAVQSIEERYPGSRYIVMVRNPVEMAYSLHNEWLFWNHEDIVDFPAAWRLSPKRRDGFLIPRGCPEPRLIDYQTMCRLGEQIEHLFGVVSRERVHVLLLDDIKVDPRREYAKLLQFLDVPDDNKMSFPAENQSKEVRWRWLQGIVNDLAHMRTVLGIPPLRRGIYTRLIRLNSRPRQRPPLPEDVREELLEFYREDIELLARLIGRSLDYWLR